MAIYKYNHPLRRAPRAQVVQSAYIADDDGKPLCPCLMLDVSSGGAKLQIEDGPSSCRRPSSLCCRKPDK